MNAMPCSMVIAGAPGTPSSVVKGLLTLSSTLITWQPSASGTVGVPLSLSYASLTNVRKSKTDAKMQLQVESQAQGVCPFRDATVEEQSRTAIPAHSARIM